MYAESRQVELGQRAIAAYEQALASYPNSGLLHAQMAWACYVAGEWERARDEAAEAARLDQLMPHLELKLSQQRLVADEAAGRDGVSPSRGESWTAEQFVSFLRKIKDR
jgi:tetratricopeptide (TPR) repeat protein